MPAAPIRTQAEIEQRRAASRYTRVGRRRPDPTNGSRRLPETAETIARDASYAGLRRLCLNTTIMAERRVSLEFRLLDKVEAAVFEGKCTIARAVKMLRGLMPAQEITALMREAQDRAGLPRKTQLDVNMEKARPVLVMAPEELKAWDERESSDAPAAPGDRDAHGATEH